MKKTLAIAVLSFVALSAQSKDIVDTAVGAGTFKTLATALTAASKETERPSFIALRTIIGWPAPKLQGTGKAQIPIQTTVISNRSRVHDPASREGQPRLLAGVDVVHVHARLVVEVGQVGDVLAAGREAR